MTQRIGVLFGRADDSELIRIAEALNYESVWAAEGQGRTAFGKLERWATVTEKIGLATGIVNVFSRSPATLAQAIATLDDHSNGRAILGLGVAHPGVVEEFHGVQFNQPLDRMAEYVELVRRYLRGDPEGFEGQFFTPKRPHFWDGFKPVRERVPIYNAALGPGNIRLTGQVADGWLPNLFPLEKLDEGLSWLETGAERAGRDVTDIDVAMYILVSVDDDPEAAYDRIAHHVAAYLRDIPGFYDRVASDAGFEESVSAAKAASSTATAADALPKPFLDLVGVAGSPETVRNELGAIRAAGVDLPIVRAPIGASLTEQRRLLRVCAP
ncbi:LLM class flavin-dependent oxidoreductase (plasmid) [Natrinema zhouii]|uniref:LLM class flavin-dependent oxidoreductase n=1 Tax=Natrinema zhouii TaxID=1710539 RepID=UPI001D0012AE|nr:LLM class flavin-dependent oxidoreductase [Natrinema zhouii]UHQ98851.1 LLM class flavin-dependent oxidoreductase [Natrinema zhouii]